MNIGKARINLLHKRFGKLYVEDHYESIKGTVYWKCRCDCGRYTRTCTSNLVHNGVHSCGHCKEPTYKRYKEIPYEFIYRIKKNALKNNREFKVSIEFLWDLFLKQNRKCALSGLDISMGISRDYKSGRTASLDRVDSSKGYTEDNVQWVHAKVNRMKMDLPESEFIQLCKFIVEFKNNIHEPVRILKERYDNN